MSRLFFQNPKFGVLDECTNATSVDVEEHLYRSALFFGLVSTTYIAEVYLEPLFEYPRQLFTQLR